MTDLRQIEGIRVVVEAARGPSTPDIARRTGAYGTAPDDSDSQFMDRFADYAIQQNPGFQSTIPGPANSTFLSRASLKAAPLSNRTYELAHASGADGITKNGSFSYRSGDFTGKADDINIIKLDAVALTTGALIRQAADGLTATIAGAVKPLQSVVDSQPLYASLLGYTGAATASGLSQIGLFVTQLAGRPGVWDLPLVTITRQETWPDNARLAIRAGSELRSTLGLSPQDQGDAVVLLGNNTTITGESTGDWLASSYTTGGARADDYHRWFFRASSKSGITLKQCRALSIKMLLTDAGANSYAQVTVGTNTSSRVLVDGGSVEFLARPASKSSGSIAFFYTTDAVARNVRMVNVPNGAQANGGDANTSVNGAIGNARKCDRIRFENIEVINSADTWVFFGMVANGSAVGCAGDGALDVGFDREGCGDASGDGVFFYNCRGRNAVNGIFANFWLNRGGAIVGGSGYQAVASQPLVAVVNPTSDIANRDFVMRGVDLSTDGGIGIVALDTAIGNIVIEGGRSRNVRWRLSGNNHFRGNMSGTVVTFDYVSSTQFTAVEVGQFHQNSGMPASCTVQNVTIGGPLQGGASIGIGISTDDPNGDPAMIVDGCKVDGFTTDIRFDNKAAAASGHKGVFQALRNTLKNKQVASVNSGGGAGAFIADGNRGFDGAPV